MKKFHCDNSQVGVEDLIYSNKSKVNKNTNEHIKIRGNKND